MGNSITTLKIPFHLKVPFKGYTLTPSSGILNLSKEAETNKNPGNKSHRGNFIKLPSIRYYYLKGNTNLHNGGRLIKKWIASIVTQIILGGYIMTIETKTVFKPVDMSGEFILWNSEIEKVIEVGEMDYIKDALVSSLDKNPVYTPYSFKLIPFKPFKNVEIEFKNEVKVKMDDNEYNNEDERYEIYDNERTNRGPIFETDYEDKVLEELARLIKDCGREDRYNLYRKVEYLTTQDVEFEKEVIINIPDQEVEVMVEKVYMQSIEEIKSPSIMTDKEIDAELYEMWNRLQALTEEKNKRVEAKKVQEAFEPDNFM